MTMLTCGRRWRNSGSRNDLTSSICASFDVRERTASSEYDQEMSNKTPPAPKPDKRDDRILGMSTSELAGVSVEEVTGNKVAVTMVMHYYKVISDENASLKNDLNTAQTYVAAYRASRRDSKIGAVLLAVSNIGIGFGVNLVTNGLAAPGSVTLIPALVLLAAGLYFANRDQE